MRHKPFHIRGRGGDGADDVFGLLTGPQASHAAVDFEMIWHAGAGQIVQRMDHGREVKFLQCGTLFGEKIRHDQNARRDSRLAQRDSLFDV